MWTVNQCEKEKSRLIVQLTGFLKATLVHRSLHSMESSLAVSSSFNRSVDSACSNLIEGDAYCVGYVTGRVRIRCKFSSITVKSLVERRPFAWAAKGVCLLLSLAYIVYCIMPF